MDNWNKEQYLQGRMAMWNLKNYCYHYIWGVPTKFISKGYALSDSVHINVVFNITITDTDTHNKWKPILPQAHP